MLLGLPMHELANVVVPIDAVLPPGFDRLPEQLAAASSWQQRFELLDDVLDDLKKEEGDGIAD